MDYTPLISIIIPTYNRAKTIVAAVKSVLEQTFIDFEIIVVDDASIDNTGELIQELQDQRIRYIKNDHNKGANASRNIGILHSKGSYIAFQDSDDVWRKDKLEKQIDLIIKADKNVGVVYTGFMHHRGKRIDYIPSKSISLYDKNGGIYQYLLLTKINIVSTQTILVKKECFDTVGVFDENMPRLQDWEMCIRLAQKYEFILIDEPLVDVYFTSESISANPLAYIKARCIMLRKFYDYKNNLEMFNYVLKDILCFSAENFLIRDCIDILDEYFNKQILNTGILVDCMISINEKREKFRSNYYTINKWLNLIEKGLRIDQYLISKGYKNIAIYGLGELGRHIYNGFRDSEIIIDYAIDKLKGNYSDININVYSLEEKLKPVDVIIVSVIYNFKQIEKELQKKITCPILSFDSIIDDMLNEY
ncbi:glycosyltransferase [Anaerocolumna sedimenticola]|uniref:Glycosyltransferase n=1 Tax=Anaerocolumna sedimenticola TaxID=2696063 RepID=A0A6P1TLY2_9FIRM|nr:glycosyltransferase family 2 protein [Anaerocolumna sedimenticola]QHQ60685.1 glycosyltransferase [Anaerocolumna sedimenticola]